MPRQQMLALPLLLLAVDYKGDTGFLRNVLQHFPRANERTPDMEQQQSQLLAHRQDCVNACGVLMHLARQGLGKFRTVDQGINTLRRTCPQVNAAAVAPREAVCAGTGLEHVERCLAAGGTLELWGFFQFETSHFACAPPPPPPQPARPLATPRTHAGA